MRIYNKKIKKIKIKNKKGNHTPQSITKTSTINLGIPPSFLTSINQVFCRRTGTIGKIKSRIVAQEEGHNFTRELMRDGLGLCVGSGSRALCVLVVVRNRHFVVQFGQSTIHPWPVLLADSIIKEIKRQKQKTTDQN
jgi:hypothetical protein